MVHKGQQTRQRAFLISLPAPQSRSHVTQDQGCEGQMGMPGSLGNLYCHC